MLKAEQFKRFAESASKLLPKNLYEALEASKPPPPPPPPEEEEEAREEEEEEEDNKIEDPDFNPPEEPESKYWAIFNKK